MSDSTDQKDPGIEVRLPADRGSDNARQLTSVQRTLRLLRLFVNKDGGLSVTEAARSMGTDKSSASRTLATLAAEGFLILDQETHRYYIGPVAFEVGSRFRQVQFARSMQPMLASFAEQTGSTAQIGTLEGNRALYLAVAPGTARLRVVASPGDVRYAHASAMGKVMLSMLSVSARERVVASLLDDSGMLPGSGLKTIRDPATLLHELDEQSQRGFATSVEEAEEGISAIAVPIRIPGGAPMAISIAFGSAQHSEQERAAFVDMLRAAAREIETRAAGGVA
jgi:IclR family acetate operon transcriptional repressor